MKGRYLNNIVMLKIDLMLRGVRFDESAADLALPFKGRAGSGIDLSLPQGMLVNVPCGEFTEDSLYRLVKRKKGSLAITDGEQEVPVKLVPKPFFFGKKTSTGIPLTDIATAHGSYVVITPSKRCEFFENKVECRYCAGNFDRSGADSRVFTVEEVLETVSEVLKEPRAGIIYLSIGFSEGDDGGVAFLEQYVRAIKKHFNCIVAVEALPPKTNRWIDDTYAMGVDSLLYNLEIFDKELFEIICPGRARAIGRQRYIEALKYAGSVFPSGTVASHLIVGLEPPGSTCQGVDFLTSIGVVPILPIYRPQSGRSLRIEPLDAEIIIPVYRHLYKAVKSNGINMNWVRDISVVTTPIEGKFLTGEDTNFLNAVSDFFYKSKFGLKAAWGLSTLRRKLRVKDLTEAKGKESLKH